MTEPATYTLEVPGAVITYDVRRNESSTEPPLLLIGSPMGAAGFATLATHFPDRTIVTYDPRGAERSTKDDPTAPSNPEMHADDLHRIIREVGGPVDLFASSGGAVNALALVAKHPEEVRTLVAHEPPLASLLPDRDAAMARIVIGAGAESEGEMANRGGHAVGGRLGTEAVAFPSHHGGFLGGEYGWGGEPEAFAAKLRDVLEG
ncbi:MAG: hypothetical protein DLM71_08865 [Chloroflexi bacterium]|nr:MAG: hypothetical protein DLM71_08865 [Chloroflexota bacterium]